MPGFAERLNLLPVRPLIGACALLVVWQAAASFRPSPWLPPPFQVWGKLAHALADGTLARNAGVTCVEFLIGLGIGTAAAILAGIPLGYYAWVRRAIFPVALLLYSIPLVGLVPPFTAVFGLGLLPKIVLGTITTFFLLFFSILNGAETIDGRLVATLRLMGASDREVLAKVILPASRRWIMTGLQTAVPFSIIAVITGEIWGSQSGLGFLIKQAVEAVDIATMYGILIILALLGVLANEGITRVNKAVGGTLEL